MLLIAHEGLPLNSAMGDIFCVVKLVIVVPSDCDRVTTLSYVII